MSVTLAYLYIKAFARLFGIAEESAIKRLRREVSENIPEELMEKLMASICRKLMQERDIANQQKDKMIS